MREERIEALLQDFRRIADEELQELVITPERKARILDYCLADGKGAVVPLPVRKKFRPGMRWGSAVTAAAVLLVVALGGAGAFLRGMGGKAYKDAEAPAAAAPQEAVTEEAPPQNAEPNVPEYSFDTAPAEPAAPAPSAAPESTVVTEETPAEEELKESGAGGALSGTASEPEAVPEPEPEEEEETVYEEEVVEEEAVDEETEIADMPPPTPDIAEAEDEDVIEVEIDDEISVEDEPAEEVIPIPPDAPPVLEEEEEVEDEEVEEAPDYGAAEVYLTARVIGTEQRMLSWVDGVTLLPYSAPAPTPTPALTPTPTPVPAPLPDIDEDVIEEEDVLLEEELVPPWHSNLGYGYVEGENVIFHVTMMTVDRVHWGTAYAPGTLLYVITAEPLTSGDSVTVLLEKTKPQPCLYNGVTLHFETAAPFCAYSFTGSAEEEVAAVVAGLSKN